MQGEALLRDLLSVEVIATLNEALCVNYRKMCAPSTELDERCGKVCMWTRQLHLMFAATCGNFVTIWGCVQATELFQAVLKARQELKDAATAAGCQDSEVILAIAPVAHFD